MNATTNNNEITQAWTEDNQILEESEILHQRLLELDEDNQILKEYETAYRRSLELAEDNQILEEYETAHRRSLEDNQILEDNLELAESTRLIEEYETAYRRSLEDNQILEDNHQRSIELAESNRLLEEYETVHQQSREIKLLRDNAKLLFTENKSELTKQVDELEAKIMENRKQIDAMSGEPDTDSESHIENQEIIADNVSYFVNHFNEIYDTTHNFDEIVYIQEIADKYRIKVQDAIKYSYNCHCCGKNTPVGYELCGRSCDNAFDFSTNYINEYVCFWGDNCKMCKGYEEYIQVCVACSNKKTDSDYGFVINYKKTHCDSCETKDDEIKENYCYWGENCENCKEYTGNEEDRFCCSCIICEKPLTDHEGYSDQYTGNVCCNNCAENHFSENVDEEIINVEKESEDYAKFYNNYIQKPIELMLDEDI